MTLLEYLDLPVKRRPDVWCPVHPRSHEMNGWHSCGRPCVEVEVDNEDGGKALTLTARNNQGDAYVAGQRDGAAIHRLITRPLG